MCSATVGSRVSQLIRALARHVSYVRAMYERGRFKLAGPALGMALVVLILIGVGTAAVPSGAATFAEGQRRMLSAGHSPALSAERVPRGFLGRLTVFKHVSVTNSSSGPVVVALSSTAAARVAAVINSLSTITPVFCHENELLYVLAFHPRVTS
jgi:hypothetical protein